MAGTLFGLGLSQQFDENGDPLHGALLYIYEANTSTPVDVYQDFSLSTLHSWPIEADANGRIPAFWMDDGNYRARLTDENGVTQFDEQNIVAMGPSTGSAPVTVSSQVIFGTGDVKWRPSEETLAGWVRCNGRFIGSATSGANERAHADTQALFEWIWNNFNNTLAPLGGGASRGVDATTDFTTNNRTITLPNMRNKSPFGLDDMGNSAAGGFSGVTFSAGDATTGGSYGGSATGTIAQANLPNVSFAVSIGSGQGSHGHPGSTVGISSTGVTYAAGGLGPPAGVTGSTGLTIAANTLPSMTGTAASGGSGTALQTVPPFLLGTWFIKL